MPQLRCVSLDQTQYVLVEVHEEICGNYSRVKALAGKVMRVGYYGHTPSEM